MPYRVAGPDVSEQVAAHQIASVVRLPESLQFAVTDNDGSQHVEEGLSDTSLICRLLTCDGPGGLLPNLVRHHQRRCN